MNSISACGKTDVGQKRNSNEDTYIVELDSGLFIVADGIEGHTRVDKASTMAIEMVRDFTKKPFKIAKSPISDRD